MTSPSTMSWRAAAIAERYNYRSYSCPDDNAYPDRRTHETISFRGSFASNQSGCMTLFKTRDYRDDPVLSYLFPPWFPIIGGIQATTFFREVPPELEPAQ